MLKHGLVFLIIVSGLLVIKPGNTLACGGTKPFILEDLPLMDLVVKATVIDTDHHHNAILQIEEYYKGEGGRFITVMRYPPALITGASLRDYTTGCLYEGRGHEWVKGSQGYFGLRNNGNGTYTDNYENYSTSAHFYVENGQITYYGNAPDYSIEMMPEADFLSYLLDTGGRTMPIPPQDNFYPLMRFLTVTTENGTHYHVNPDRSLTPLPEDYPLAISPDGAHVAFRRDDEHIIFQYIWITPRFNSISPDEEDEERHQAKLETLTVTGKSVEFANESNFAVVWDQTQLAVYMLMNEGEFYEDFGNGMSIVEIAQVPVQWSVDSTLPAVLWSADSTTLVWEDESGIWHWNLYDAAAPQQLMSAADLENLHGVDSALLDVSIYGRYVRAGTSEAWSLIDAETLTVYPDALAAPTEQLLIFPQDGTRSYNVLECKPPLRENCNVALFRLENSFIYQGNLIGLFVCNPDTGNCMIYSDYWHPSIVAPVYDGTLYLWVHVAHIRQVAYDQQYEKVALLVGDYGIYFDFYDDDYFNHADASSFDVLDLEGQLDSPIASIEWEQPIFYNQYFLTSSEYMPR